LKIRVLAGITTAEKERESANQGDLKEGLKKSGWKFTTERREMEVTKKEGMAGGNTTGKERKERKKERKRERKGRNSVWSSERSTVSQTRHVSSISIYVHGLPTVGQSIYHWLKQISPQNGNIHDHRDTLQPEVLSLNTTNLLSTPVDFKPDHNRIE